MKQLTRSAAVLLLFATVAAAQTITPGSGYNQTIELKATKAGEKIGAEGAAARKRTRDKELFALKVHANLPDGTQLLVVAATKETRIIMGTVELFFGVGLFKLESDPSDPTAPPLEDLVAVYVTDLTDVLLQGEFPPLIQL